MLTALIAIIILLTPFAFIGIVALCRAAHNGDEILGTRREREGYQQICDDLEPESLAQSVARVNEGK